MSLGRTPIKVIPDWVKSTWSSSLRRFSIESHHGIPRSVQGWFGIPEQYWDDAPALLTTMMKHRGAGGESVHAVIAKKMADKLKENGMPNAPDSWGLNRNRPPINFMSDSEILEAMQSAYGELDLKHFWNESVGYLELRGIDLADKFIDV